MASRPLACTLLLVSAAAARKPPHVLLIVADDYGWNDVGYHTNHSAVGYLNTANPSGLPVTNAAAGIMRTPTIDRLAHEGIKLENYYVQPLCSPTRSTLMTGRYPSHTGIGPSVIVIYNPFGVPAREVMVPKLLKDAGYATHMVGKWHLGACDNRYEPTYRGFDSFMGYLAGGEGYYDHANDFRNGSAAGETPFCMGDAVRNNYSSTLFAGEVSRIVAAHGATTPGTPMFVYLAFQSVHNPYDDPIDSGVPGTNVNATYPEIVDPTRRIYAGMVAALDAGVAEVEQAYKSAGMWDDTVTIFTTDNGGIEFGNNYPLRGMKVLLWEGGIRGVSWVRGSKDFPIRGGGHTSQLMHSTDWLPTICSIAGASTAATLPLDGHDQWQVLAAGAVTERITIFHNVPVGAAPVLEPNSSSYTTSACLSHVDNRTGPCGGFGLTGGAMRKGDWKLLTTFPGPHPWQDSAPAGIAQYTPGGRYPNGTAVFTPSTNDTLPQLHIINATLGVFLFNLSADPTETHNLAAAEPAVLHDMLETYSQYAATAVIPLTFRYGFKDPKAGNSLPRPDEAHCQGQFGGSSYCSYGHEFDCMIKGRGIRGGGIGGDPAAGNGTACHAACTAHTACTWWSRLAPEGCRFFDGDKPVSSTFVDCDSPASCEYGPADCGFGMPAGNPFPGPAVPPPPPPCASTSTECFVTGHGLQGGDCCGGIVPVEPTDKACQAACQKQARNGCEFWVRRGTQCHLKAVLGQAYAGPADYGPRCCPAAAGNEEAKQGLPAFYHLW